MKWTEERGMNLEKKEKMNKMWEKKKWKMEDGKEAECSEYK